MTKDQHGKSVWGEMSLLKFLTYKYMHSDTGVKTCVRGMKYLASEGMRHV